MCSAGVPVPTTAGSRRLAGLVLSWPAALLGFGPSQLLSGRTVRGTVVHAAKAHLSFARSRSSSSVFLEASDASNLSSPTRLRPIRMCRVRFLGFVPSVPAIRGLSFMPRIMLPWALPLSGVPDTYWCRLTGRSFGCCRWTGRTLPVALISRRRSASGGSPLLSFGTILASSAGTPMVRWTKAGLARHLLFSDSGGRCLVPPYAALPGCGRTSRMRFFTC